MDRLTHLNGNGDIYFLVDGIRVRIDEIEELRVAEKLKRYEDLEEKGQLDIWPCVLGQHVYWVHDGVITDCHVYRFQKNRKGKHIVLRAGRKSHGAFSVLEIGKTLFLSYEEAKAKLNI